jgi:hypothetical protein
VPTIALVFFIFTILDLTSGWDFFLTTADFSFRPDFSLRGAAELLLLNCFVWGAATLLSAVTIPMSLSIAGVGSGGHGGGGRRGGNGGDLDDVTPTVSTLFAATMATMDADEDSDDDDAVQVALPLPAEGEWEEVVERTVVVADGMVVSVLFVVVV